MRRLSFQTRIYIIGTLLAGTILFTVSVLHWNWQKTWIQTIVLSLLGALTLLFKVEGSTDRTHYDFTFLIYGCSLILFGAPCAVIVILAAHMIEWIWHKYPWYIQTFNIASYIVVAVTTDLVYELINSTRNLDGWQGAISVLAVMAVFTFLNHLMVGIIVWMARGETFVQSGIFRFFPIMLDWILLCMGAGVAVIWNYNPFAVIPFLLPLYLIYSTLRVPALERQVETDGKTGLYNHKYFMNGLEAELRRAARFDRPLTVVMADIDLLRNINSLYGHLAGDVVLTGIARILKNCSRDYDVVARFGGEEFALLMPETTPEEAYPKVNFLRMTIEKEEFTVQTSVTPIKASMSFGIAGREEGLDGNGIIHKADMALYQAKLAGRNRAYLASNKGFIDLFQSSLEPDSALTYHVEEKAQSLVPDENVNIEVPTQLIDEHKASSS
jgi:diguanylate cyclase (GGDEF)-like protein